MSKTILAIGDAHFPFTCTKSIRKVIQLAELKKPDVIIQIGDLYDLFSFSKYPRSLDYIKPKDEIEQARILAEAMWRSLYKASPKSKRFQLLGNHDERPMKKIQAVAPEFESLISIKDLFSFPNVETMNAERDELIIDKILIMHGFRSKLGDHARHNGMKTIVGHSHHGGVTYTRLGKDTIWELNCGFVANEDSVPLGYTKQRRISTWTQGCGWVDELGPRFIPFENP